MTSQHTVSSRRGRWIEVIALVGVVAMLAYSAHVALAPWPEVIFKTDFVSFWTGASLVRAGEADRLFDMEAQHVFQSCLRLSLASSEEMRQPDMYVPRYINPPPLVLVFFPLAWLTMPTAYVLWWIMSLLCLIAAIILPLRGSPHALMKAALMLMFPAVLTTLLEGQVNGPFVLSFSVALLALTSGHSFGGGAAMGLMWLKPQYAMPFVLILIVKRRGWELTGMVATGLVLAAISLLMVGASGVIQYTTVLREIGAFYPPAEALVSPQAMVNWRALVMNLWPGLSEAAGASAVLGLGGLTMVLALTAWRGDWDSGSPRFPLQMLVAMLAAVVASPHSHYHGVVMLLAPVALAIAKPLHAVPLAWMWRLMLPIGYLLGLLAWAERSWSWLLVPYFLAAMAILAYQCGVDANASQREADWRRGIAGNQVEHADSNFG